MKILKAMAIFVLAAGLCVTAHAEMTQRTGKVLDLVGKAEVKAPDQAYRPAEVGTVLNEGDIIKTGSGSWALVKLHGDVEEATVEVDENSELLLSELVEDKKEGVQKTLLDLALGRVLIRAEKVHRERSKFQVKTPTSVVGVRGTTFAVKVEALE